MPTTNMTAIQTVTVGSGGASTIEFTSIPQTYTDLVIKVSARSNTSVAGNGFLFDIRPNGSSANMTRRSVYGNGSSTASSSGSDGYNMALNASDYTASVFSSSDIYICNYASTSVHKTISTDTTSENNATAVLTLLGAMTWANTAAITSIQLTPLAGLFVEHSTATLYGVKNFANNETSAYATGGTITSDGQYWYHAFTSSGTFTPTKTLSCDVLVVAGGGGGTLSSASSGGSGAGGLLTFTAQSVSAVPYTVTVGAGGTGGVSASGSYAYSSNPTNGNNSQFGALTASVGGGIGGGFALAAAVGGSGGGGQTNAGTGAAGTAGQGNAGGTAGTGGNFFSGAGGGAGGAGGAGTAGLAAGGIGATSTLITAMGNATSTGVLSGGSRYFAGGGGGSSGNGAAGGGAGGLGGGGQGATALTPPQGSAGTANTGGGAGAGSNSQALAYTCPNGGSGIVIVRYSVSS